ncbi:hypothetical protein CEXT_612551, partial [Caerostris extrusa]
MSKKLDLTQADIKILETQLAVAHDWNGTAKDVAQGDVPDATVPDGHADSTKKKIK